MIITAHKVSGLKPRAYGAPLLRRWGPLGVEHDFEVAEATYRAAVARPRSLA